MRVSVDGRPVLHAVGFGAGAPVLVAIGGWIGTWELWQQPMELLAGWRTIAYDHRGAGETVVTPEEITVDALVADVFAVLDAYGVERCVLAGESQGAIVAVLAALARPDRFDGLVLVGGAPAWELDEGRRRFGDWLRRDRDAALRWFVEACLPEDTDGYHRRWGLNVLRRAELPAALRLLEALDGVDVTGRLAEVQQRTLVLHGAKDVIMPPAGGAVLAAGIPDARYVVLDDAGHVPTLSRPERVAQEIRSVFAPPG